MYSISINRCVCVQLPPSPLRGHSLILSIGQQGVVVDISSSAAAGTTTSSTGAVVLSSSGPISSSSGSRSSGGVGDRMEWAGQPVAMHRLTPFLLTLLTDSVEVHNEASLMALQRIKFPAGSASASLSMATCLIGGASGMDQAFVSTGDQLIMLRMVPLNQQVFEL